MNYLIVVDNCTKWLEVVSMTSTTAGKTIDVLGGGLFAGKIIDVLERLFACHGLAGEVVSDNIPSSRYMSSRHSWI